MKTYQFTSADADVVAVIEADGKSYTSVLLSALLANEHPEGEAFNAWLAAGNTVLPA
jgi:hypothetical protein